MSSARCRDRDRPAAKREDIARKEYQKGFEAGSQGKPESECPHSEANFLKRCAWMGGLYDAKHGYEYEPL